MNTILQIETRHPDEIIIIDRARQDAGDITSLAENISAVGQLNPILINSQNVLIAGERRLLAIKQLSLPQIEVRVVDGVQPDDQLMIELFENLGRKDFTWHEDIDLKYKLHNFWTAKAAEDGKEWGYRATAKKLKCSLGGLSTDLALAEAMKVFPELKDQSSKSRAREVYKAYGNQAQALQRMNSLSETEQENLQKLQSGIVELPIKNTVPEHVSSDVQQKSKEITSLVDAAEAEPAPKLDVKVIYVSENYKKFLTKIPDQSVGFIELDPPYAINYDQNYGEETNKMRSSDDWTEKDLYDFYCGYLPVLYQKLTASAWILCWTGKEHFLRINEIAAQAGFVTQEPGVWVKTGGGSSHLPKRKLISNWEMYLLFRKGDSQFNTASLRSAISIPTVPPSQRIHRWEKPLDLYDHFFKALGSPGTIFLSPFAGSGNSLISAAKAGMMPIGCDKSAKYIPQFYSRVHNYLGVTPDIEGI